MARTPQFLTVIDHPLVQSDLARLRDRSTGSEDFRILMRRISLLMAYEVTRSLKTERIRLKTPLEPTGGIRIRDGVALIPILRAGLGMIEGFLEVLPDAKVGHIGIYRNEETLRPVDYYLKLPPLNKGMVTILLDPMLATGGSACAAIGYLRSRGAKDIVLAGIVAAPRGVQAVHEAHPAVRLFTCAVDRKLNANGYILPGLGDAGDRFFGTE
jgi:uracil phosphoribosyltransferase